MGQFDAKKSYYTSHLNPWHKQLCVSKSTARVITVELREVIYHLGTPCLGSQTSEPSGQIIGLNIPRSSRTHFQSSVPWKGALVVIIRERNTPIISHGFTNHCKYSTGAPCPSASKAIFPGHLWACPQPSTQHQSTAPVVVALTMEGDIQHHTHVLFQSTHYHLALQL